MTQLGREVRNIIECAICNEIMNNPKVLSCHHTFCLACIEGHGRINRRGNTLSCPLCRMDFNVPAGGLSNLDGNFIVAKLIAAQSPAQSNAKNHPCDKHPTKEIEYYCKPCKSVMCVSCHIVDHDNHACCEISDIADEFRNRLKILYKETDELLKNVNKQTEIVDKKKISCLIEITKAEAEIKKNYEEIKQMVDRHMSQLMKNFNSRKSEILKNIQKDKEKLQQHSVVIKKFEQNCQEWLTSTDSVEMVRLHPDMELRARKLTKLSIINTSELHESLRFVPSSSNFLGSGVGNNTIGSISVKHPINFTPWGFTITNDKLFVIRFKSTGIRVFKIQPLAYQRTITLEGMKDPWDIVAGQNVLYVSEREDNLIHRIQLPEEIKSSWTVDGTCLRLSISMNGNVIVASWRPATIFEYTSDGACVREIAVNRIDPDLIGLQHAIQLEGDKFLVCHAVEDTHHRVCLIDNTGRVIKYYGGNKGSGMGQLNVPCYLAIGRNGCILVADRENNRIVQLNASLECMSEFDGFKQTTRLLVNPELKRLYLIEFNKQRITILDI